MNDIHEESHIDTKLHDLAFFEPSDSDDELSAYQKSTTTSSKQNLVIEVKKKKLRLIQDYKSTVNLN